MLHQASKLRKLVNLENQYRDTGIYLDLNTSITTISATKQPIMKKITKFNLVHHIA